MAEAQSSSSSPSPSSPCGDGFTCILFLGVHGTVRLQVNETTLQQSKSEEEMRDISLEESLGQPLQITALPLSVISIDGGLTGYIAPAGLGYSVMGSENSQFAQYIEAFIRMVEGKPTCLTGSDIARFFNSSDDEMYSYFDSRFNKQLQDLQTRFLARAPQDPADFEKFDFTKNFVTFASNEMLKHDFFNKMKYNRTSGGLVWGQHNSCIAEKLYCPGTHANQCCLYFPGVCDDLHDQLRTKLYHRRRLSKPGQAQQPLDAEAKELFKGLSIEFSSDREVVLAITFENDRNGGGFVENQRWKGIPLNLFFEQIKRYLKFVFRDVDGFDGILDGLMSKTCVIDTACSNFSVPVPGKHVSIIGIDNGLGASVGVAEAIPNVSMVLDIHNVPSFEMGWWERKINPPSGSAVGAVTHSRHRLSIPRDLVSYVPSGLVCDNTIKSVEPIFDKTTGKLSVVYTYRNGRQEIFVHEPPSSGAAAAVGGPSDSMGGVRGDESPRGDISDGDLGGGGRKPLYTTRRVRSLRNKSKTKRSNKIRGFRRRGVRRTRRKRTRRTLRR